MIVILCVIPGDEIPLPPVIGIDKIGHVGMFMVLGWLWLRTPGGFSLPDARISFVVTGVVLAIGTELAQHYVVPGRYGDLYDAIADIAGVGLVLAIHHHLGGI